MYGETKEAMIADLEKQGIHVNEAPPPPKPGATGVYPEGKSSPDDEGQLAMRMTRIGDQVRMDFGKEVSWLSMSAHDTKLFASKLMAMAGGTKDN